MFSEIESGIIIGAFGGAAAGVILWVISRLNDYEIEWRQKNRIYKWLDKETKSDPKKWKSTRYIASYTNLPEDRVRYLCSNDKRIVLSSKQDKEMWGIMEETGGAK